MELTQYQKNVQFFINVLKFNPYTIQGSADMFFKGGQDETFVLTPEGRIFHTGWETGAQDVTESITAAVNILVSCKKCKLFAKCENRGKVCDKIAF